MSFAPTRKGDSNTYQGEFIDYKVCCSNEAKLDALMPSKTCSVSQDHMTFTLSLPIISFGDFPTKNDSLLLTGENHNFIRVLTVPSSTVCF